LDTIIVLVIIIINDKNSSRVVLVFLDIPTKAKCVAKSTVLKLDFVVDCVHDVSCEQRHKLVFGTSVPGAGSSWLIDEDLQQSM